MTLQNSAVQSAPPPVDKSQILNDDEIERLLQEAEARLIQASRLTVQAAKTPEDQDLIAVENVGRRKPYVCITHHMRTSTEIRRLPKLTDSLKRASYVEQKNGIAQADGKRLVDDKQRKLSNVLKDVGIERLKKGKHSKVSRHVPVSFAA
jgi:phage terminase large subunit-like protein